MNIRVSDFELIAEINRRIDCGDIFRAKNGKLWPKLCPACGGTIIEYGITIDYTPEEVAVLNYDQWRTITRSLLDKEALYLPDIMFRETGRLYYVRCNNSLSECNPCPVVNWDWYHDLDDARQDFFDKASEYV